MNYRAIKVTLVKKVSPVQGQPALSMAGEFGRQQENVGEETMKTAEQGAIAPSSGAADGHGALKRSMKLLGTLLITVSAITPASSVFIIAPGVIQQAGSGAFLAFVAAAVVGIFMAYVY